MAAALATLAGFALVACQAAKPAPPNVVLIVVESLRTDHLDHFGYTRPTAVALDAFRDQATRFGRATAPSPWAKPSVASLLTGRFPLRHGVVDANSKLEGPSPTLAEILRANGYATTGFSHNALISRKAGFDRGFDQFEDELGVGTDYSNAGAMTDRLREWLAGRPQRPFFLYLHVMNPHGPYRVPAARRAALLGEPPSRKFRWGSRNMRAILQGREGPEPKLEPEVLASLVDQYDTAVRYALDEVGAQLELLRQTGLYDDSLIVLTSDHGEELFDHHGFDHGYTLHGEVLRVPLYVKRPGPAPAAGAGLRVDGRVSLLDVVPTVLDLLGLPPVEGAGVSLVPLLDGAPGDRKRTLYYHTAWRTRAEARAVVSGRYKLIETRFDARGTRDRTQLYDLTLDPEERNDLFDQGEEIAERLAAEAESAFAAYRGAHAVEAP